MGHNLEALKKALEAAEALGVIPMDLLAYSIVLDNQNTLNTSTDLQPGTTLLDLVEEERQLEAEEPTWGTDILDISVSIAEQMQ